MRIRSRPPTKMKMCLLKKYVAPGQKYNYRRLIIHTINKADLVHTRVED